MFGFSFSKFQGLPQHIEKSLMIVCPIAMLWGLDKEVDGALVCLSYQSLVKQAGHSHKQASSNKTHCKLGNFTIHFLNIKKC